MLKRVAAVALVGVFLAAAGIAAAGNFSAGSASDFSAAGTHRFHVWCSGTSDYVATAYGANVQDAQDRLYQAAKVAGHPACWPVWQGKIS